MNKIVVVIVFIAIICYLALPSIGRYRSMEEKSKEILENSLVEQGLFPREGCKYIVNSKLRTITIVKIEP